MYRVEGATPPRRWRRVLLIATACLVGAVVVGIGGAYIWLNVVLGGSRVVTSDISLALDQATTVTTSTGTTAETTPEPPDAMNIILFGADRQEEGEEFGRSDSIMVVHVDPTNDFVSVLSLPRDLRVEIPEHGVGKLNAAYSYGGPALAIRTVQQLTNIDMKHYVNIEFDAFRQVTTELGGVWVDVDRRYYHQPQVGAADPWENIDIQAGYQRLMGENALDFVRFRHDGNVDFGRMERQQLFLRAAQRQLVGLGTALKLPELVSIVASNVETSLKTRDILSLAWFGVRLDGSRIKSVKLEGADRVIDGVDYLVYDDDEVRARVKDFLTPPAKEQAVAEGGQTTTSGGTQGEAGAGEETDLSGMRMEVLNGSGRTGQAGAAAALLRQRGAEVVNVGNATVTGRGTRVFYPAGARVQAQSVIAALGVGSAEEDPSLDYVKVVVGTDFFTDMDSTSSPGASGIIYEQEYVALQTQVPFALMGPGYLPTGCTYKDRRVYEIDAGGEKLYPAVKTIYQLGEEDQYLGIMQTTFTGAPAAAGGEVVTENGTTYTVVGISGKVDHIWWKRGKVLYWVSNTLMHRLTGEQLLKVATSMIAIEE